MNYRYLRLFFLLISSMFLSCSDLSNPQDIDSFEINDILENVEMTFNSSNIDALLENYDSNFLHDGDELHEERILWQVRLNDYDIIEIEDITIEYLDDFKAIVSFTLNFDNDEFICPADISDLSYMFKRENEWKIYGNQID